MRVRPNTILEPGIEQHRAEGRRVHVVQGEYHVSADSDVILTTILGSCVSACLYDPIMGIGGMNHFLLPGDGKGSGFESLRYGVHAMELLVNGLLQKGARRERLEAKLFGGGRMMGGLSDIGGQNAAFAERFLRDEGIRFTGGSLRGNGARRVQFWPVSGRARQALVNENVNSIFEAEKPPILPRVTEVSQPDSDDIELF